MYIYLSGSGAEVFLPTALSAQQTEEALTLLDGAGQIVAVFPSVVVVIHSMVRLQPSDPNPESGMVP